MVQPRFLILAFPLQGTINPCLNLANQLIRVANAQVTFVTSVNAHRLIMTTHTVATTSNNLLSFSPFFDGYDEGVTDGKGFHDHFVEFKRRGWQAVGDILELGFKEGRPYTCLVYSILLTWAADVAATHNVPASMFWMQPATVFDVYYYYFHGHKEIICANTKNHSFSLSFPGIPLTMNLTDLPSLMVDSNYSYILTMIHEMYKDFEKESNNTKIILVNTFDELEPDALRAINKFNLIGIGPLITSKTSFSFRNYIEWLNTKPKKTVVYVSFGSILILKKQQMDEIAKGLLEFGHPFLWVIKEKNSSSKEGVHEDNIKNELSYKEELEKLGMIVPWCSQMEVLRNESLGCFVTHCGWNSTLESIVSGVPVVAFPQWTDQQTNAKLIEEMWKIGVRVKPDEDGIVKSEEIKRCLELVMSENENRTEIVKNVKKWQNLTKEAMREGGSSEKNLITFVKSIHQ